MVRSSDEGLPMIETVAAAPLLLGLAIGIAAVAVLAFLSWWFNS